MKHNTVNASEVTKRGTMDPLAYLAKGADPQPVTVGALPSHLTSSDIDRVLGAADQFIEDWEDNEGNPDPEFNNDADEVARCARVRREFNEARPLMVAAPALLEFVQLIARMNADGESVVDDAHHEFHMDGDDAIGTLSELIVSARKLLNEGKLFDDDKRHRLEIMADLVAQRKLNFDLVTALEAMLDVNNSDHRIKARALLAKIKEGRAS